MDLGLSRRSGKSRACEPPSVHFLWRLFRNLCWWGLSCMWKRSGTSGGAFVFTSIENIRSSESVFPKSLITAAM